MSKIDTIVFDVDGVLIDVSKSYTQAVKDTVRRYVKNTGSDATLEQQMAALRRAGGFNNDWDLAYGLIALMCARGKLSDPDQRPLEVEEIAAMTGGRGLEFVSTLVPPGTLPGYEEVRATGERLYWGSDTAEQPQRDGADHESEGGLRMLEQPLVTFGFFDKLRGLGVKKLGIFTGRDRRESRHALEILGYTRQSPFDVILTSEEFSKPDPAALFNLARVLETTRGIYVGDTGDDLRLVQEYSKSATRHGPTFASVMIATGAGADYFKRNGADVVLGTAGELPRLLETTPSH